MSNSERGNGSLARAIPVLLFLLYIPAMLIGAEGTNKQENDAGFDLMIKDDLISLKAEDSSLIMIVEEIGRKMDIEVDAQISDDVRVTETFSRLTLEDALERLSANYAYLLDSKKNKGKITRIVLLSKGNEEKKIAASERVAKEKQRPEPFKFTFDPKNYLNKKE